MSGHFHLSVAAVCVNCESCFPMQSTCPACQSDAIYPVETWLSRRAGTAYTARALAELYGLRVLKSA
jgi:hypothetical protein